MHVSKTKFERNSSLECYHMTCIRKQNIQAKEIYCEGVSQFFARAHSYSKNLRQNSNVSIVDG